MCWQTALLTANKSSAAYAGTQRGGLEALKCYQKRKLIIFRYGKADAVRCRRMSKRGVRVKTFAFHKHLHTYTPGSVLMWARICSVARLSSHVYVSFNRIVSLCKAGNYLTLICWHIKLWIGSSVWHAKLGFSASKNKQDNYSYDPVPRV